MKVSIILVNYNSSALLRQCLKSIYEQTKEIPFEIIVVDNASSDNSREIVCSEFSNVQLIKSAENLGFSRGNNLGASLAKGTYLLFLNTDTILFENSIKKVFDFAESLEGNEIIGCKLLNEDKSVQKSVYDFPTSNNVSILLGNGDGTFQGAVNYATVWLPSYVAAGDFNRDGKLDLAVMNYGTGTNNVSILLGNGDGTFQAAVNYGAGDSGSTIAVDDFNRDGIPDLAATYNYCCFPYDNDISILLGNGDGTFSEAVYYAVGDGTSSVTTGDFNGDGKPDLAAANRGSNNVSILLNTAIYITASAGANGNISPSGTLGVYSGDNQSFVITPDACYHVADVLVDGVSGSAAWRRC